MVLWGFLLVLYCVLLTYVLRCRRLKINYTPHGSEGITPSILTSPLDVLRWSAWRPVRFTPWWKAPGSWWIGGWVGPRAGLVAVGKRKAPAVEDRTHIPGRLVCSLVTVLTEVEGNIITALESWMTLYVKTYERYKKINSSSSSKKLCYWNLSLFIEFSLDMKSCY
jgi:hypothetical protein